MNAKLHKVHDELLDLLKDFDQICVDNGIKYSIGYGTAIGAVRHKGFIPWDDDADIIMDLKNYSKLINVLPNEFEIHQRSMWIPRFKKRKNPLDVDILLFCSVSSNKFKRNIKVLMLQFLQGTLKDKLTVRKGFFYDLFSLATYTIGKFIPRRRKIQIYNLVSSKYFNGDTLMFSAYDDFILIRKTFSKEIFKSYSRIKFENIELMLIDEYDEFLTTVYGDYMTPPPKKERFPSHGHISKIEID